MAISILMPALSPTMKEGKLAKWLKKEGDHIISGDVIAEIETDKAIMDIESVEEGVLAKIIIPEGSSNVKINEIIAILAEEGEYYLDIKNSYQQEYEKTTEENNTNLSSTGIEPVLDNEKKQRLLISPIAKRIAQQNSMNIDEIQGSGPRGRIIKYDVEKFLSNKHGSSNICKSNDASCGHKEMEISSIRKIIAKRLVESKQEIPHFYLEMECTVEKLLNLREEINTKIDKNHESELKISVNDIFIKASALALDANPKVNSALRENKIIQFDRIDIAVAVALKDGVITPVIKNANCKNLTQISNEMKELVKKARSQKLKAEEYEGGNFTISNLGMYSIKSFYAIINPPQSCILSIGSIREIPAFDLQGNIIKRRVVNICISCDHRILDGVTVSVFLNTLRGFIENPSLMLCY